MQKPIIILVVFVFFIALFIFSFNSLTGYFAAETSEKDIIYEEQSCYTIEALALPEIPNEIQINYISLLRPKFFGIIAAFPDVERAEWINNLDPDEFGYEFKKFYGNTDYDNLIILKPYLDKVDIIGYCPLYTPNHQMDEAQLSNRIDSLRDEYPDKEILIGPCIDLFDKIRGSVNKPDYLGFELLQNDIDNYLDGEYDDIINEIQQQRVDLNMYLAIGNSIDLEKVKKVLNKAIAKNLTIAYMIDGSKEMFNFLINTSC